MTVLSAADPVRVFQEFATLDLVSGGRAEMIVGRGSFIEAFPLFGLEFEDYDSLFEEKLDLLLHIRGNTHVHWSGNTAPRSWGSACICVRCRIRCRSRPEWAARRARSSAPGLSGYRLMVAIIGGGPRPFRPLIELYRQAWQRAGRPVDGLNVGIHS